MGCASWALKNWCFWTVVLEKTLESPLDCKEIQPVNPKGNQSWIFIGRTDAEAEAPTLWPPDVKNWVIGKDPHAGKDWGQVEKGTTEDKMVGWHQLNGHEFEQAQVAGERQGSLACCSPWGCKELDMTERLGWTEIKIKKKMWCIYTMECYSTIKEKEIVSFAATWMGIEIAVRSEASLMEQKTYRVAFLIRGL